MGDQGNIGENLRSTIQAFTPAVRDIVESFEFHLQVDKLDKAGLLYMVGERFAQIDLHPETVSNAEMGLVFEELSRKFAELSNETAGEHFKPHEVLKLMVNLIFSEGDQALTQAGSSAACTTPPRAPAACSAWRRSTMQAYFEPEVLPHGSDAWIDHEKTKVGDEIPFNRHFSVFTPPRPLEVIDAELKQVTDRILAMIGGLSGWAVQR